MSTTFRRPQRKRRLVPISELAAREAIGLIGPGTEIYGLTDGALSLIDILAHALTDTDSRDVVMATWTAATGSLQAFRDLCRSKAIRHLRLIVDPSFRTRKPDDLAELYRLYGADHVRFVPTHAKFTVLTGGRCPVTVRSSMNLNTNRRIESFEISTCPELAAFHLAFADEIFSRWPSLGPQDRAQQHDRPVTRKSGFVPPKPIF